MGSLVPTSRLLYIRYSMFLHHVESLPVVCVWFTVFLLCLQSVREGCTTFVSSSGGNAGLAAAYSAKELGIPITVVVPEPTPDFIVKKLRDEGATVEVVGKVHKSVSSPMYGFC